MGRTGRIPRVNQFETDPSQAARSGIIAGVAAGLTGLTALVIGLLIPPSLATLFCLLIVSGAVASVIWLVYHGRSIQAMSYNLDRNSFVIRWGGAREIIPMADVQRIIPGSDIADGLRVRRLPLPGWWVCEGRHAALGHIRFYATAPLESQSIIVTPDRSFGVSPIALDDFDEAFSTRLAMRPTQDVRYARLLPGLRSDPLWTDRPARALIAVGVVGFLALLALVLGAYPGLPQSIPLHYDALGQVDRYGPSSSALGLAGIAAGALAANLVLGGLLFRANERLAGYLAWGGGILIQMLFVAAAATLLGG